MRQRRAIAVTAQPASAVIVDVAPTATAVVTVSAGGHVQRIPHSFFGLSTEYGTLPADERHVALYTRILSMLHVPSDGRYILRIGGDSTSRTFFDPQGREGKAWVVAIAGGRAHVLLINKGGRDRQVALSLPARGSASVQRLLAPGPAARHGETLGGQQLNHAAEWVGDAEHETIPQVADRYLIPLPAYSAALVALRVG